MRGWLYNRIINMAGKPIGAGTLPAYSSAGSLQPTPPFLIISMGTEVPPLGLPAESRTQMVPFTVWVHTGGDSMVLNDDICVWLKNGLPTEDGFKVGNMSIYSIKWEDTGGDAYDDHFKTNTRPVRFSMMTRR